MAAAADDRPRADLANGLPTERSLGSAPSAGELVTDLVTELVENSVTVMWLIAEAVSGVLQAVTLGCPARGSGAG